MLSCVLKMTRQVVVQLCNHTFSLSKPHAKCSIRNPIPKVHSNKCTWCSWFSDINYLAAHSLHSVVWVLLGDNTYCSQTIHSVNRKKNSPRELRQQHFAFNYLTKLTSSSSLQSDPVYSHSIINSIFLPQLTMSMHKPVV